MTAEHEPYARLISSMMDRMVRLPAEMRVWQKHWRKAQRPDLAQAKRFARMLRRTLVCVSGYHLWICSDHVERWINTYLEACKKLRVTPPVVAVPRSLQGRFGKTVGGPTKLSWRDVAELDDGLDYLMAFAQKEIG